MGRTAGRSTSDTKGIILDAAALVIREQGLAASLDQIAAAAGVSKGGLLYHFPSKADLLRALAERLTTTFRQQVQAAVASDDDRPGRITRAYVRAGLRDAENSAALREQLVLDAQLMSDRAVHAVISADSAWWREAFASDGLPAGVIRVVVAAVDGASSAPLLGTVLEDGDLAALETALLRLTAPPYGLGAADD